VLLRKQILASDFELGDSFFGSGLQDDFLLL